MPLGCHGAADGRRGALTVSAIGLAVTTRFGGLRGWATLWSWCEGATTFRSCRARLRGAIVIGHGPSTHVSAGAVVVDGLGTAFALGTGRGSLVVCRRSSLRASGGSVLVPSKEVCGTIVCTIEGDPIVSFWPDGAANGRGPGFGPAAGVGTSRA